MKAYVLMQVQPGLAREVARRIKGKGAGGARCTSAEVVAGPYDIICTCVGPSVKAIGECVLDCCSGEDVQRTTTCFVA